MLGLLTSGHFAHPSKTYWLYDEVRSKAVHGDEPPEVSEREVNSLAWDVRVALNEYLHLARAEGFTRRKHVRDALDGDERRAEIIAALLDDDPTNWRSYVEFLKD